MSVWLMDLSFWWMWFRPSASVWTLSSSVEPNLWTQTNKSCSDAIEEPFSDQYLCFDECTACFWDVEMQTRRLCWVSNPLSLCLQMFSVAPRRFLPDVKNPCWFEELRGDVSADPYGSNLFGRSFRQIQLIFEQLSGSFTQRLTRHDGRLQRLRCLPYFYIIGQPKCGTTDLYDRLRLHPEVHFTTMKEPHWWTRKRFGEFHIRDKWQSLKCEIMMLDGPQNVHHSHFLAMQSICLMFITFSLLHKFYS